MVRSSRLFASVLIFPFALALIGCGGSEGGDTSFPTFSVDPSNSVVSGIGERNGQVDSVSTGAMRLEFGDAVRSLAVSVPAGQTLPAVLTFGTTSGLSGRVQATSLSVGVAWAATSGTVRLSRKGSNEIVAELDAAFVPDPDGNASASSAISSGFRMRGTGTAQ